MKMITLQAEPRTALGHKVGALRREGKIPAVVYGKKVETRSITLDTAAFARVFREIGQSTLVELKIEGEEPVMVLLQEASLDPVKEQPVHVDFLQVVMDEPIRASIPITFVGIAPAVKAMGGVLMKPREQIDVEALPGKLVDEIVVDLSVLETEEDAIRMRDLVIPDGVAVLSDLDLIVAKVAKVRRAAEAEEGAEGEKAEESSEEKKGEDEKSENDENKESEKGDKKE